jgi:hypothetical protein
MNNVMKDIEICIKNTIENTDIDKDIIMNFILEISKYSIIGFFTKECIYHLNKYLLEYEKNVDILDFLCLLNINIASSINNIEDEIDLFINKSNNIIYGIGEKDNVFIKQFNYVKPNDIHKLIYLLRINNHIIKSNI